MQDLQYYDGTEWISLKGSDGQNGGDGTPPIQSGGRLTLSPTDPTPSQDITGSTLYYLPSGSDTISLFDGEKWVSRIFEGFSADLAGLTNTIPYDVYILFDEATDSHKMEFVQWTNDTTRSAELVRQNGVYVSPSDSKKRYMGSVRKEADGLAHFTSSIKGVYNAFNRIGLSVGGANFIQHVYSGRAWRNWNNNTTPGEGRAYMLLGTPQPVSAVIVHLGWFYYAHVSFGDIAEPWNANMIYEGPAHNALAGTNESNACYRTVVMSARYTFIQSVEYGLDVNTTFQNFYMTANYQG